MRFCLKFKWRLISSNFRQTKRSILSQIMNIIEPIKVSHFDSRSRSQILSQEPLLSSRDLNWQGVQFDYYQHEPDESPIHINKHHVLSLTLHQAQPERKLKNIYQQENHNLGSVAIIPANVEHYCAWKSTLKFIILSFTPQILAKIAPEAIDANKIELLPAFAKSEPDWVITGIGMGIKQQLETNPNGCNFYVEHLNNALLAHLLKNYCTINYLTENFSNGLPPYKLDRAINYINDNLDRQIKIANIAKLLNISQYYFCRLFHNSMKISPYKYVIRQRIAKAKHLIKDDTLPLADVAYRCGFSSQSQMTHHFRKCLGVTPKVYRNKL